MRGWSFPSIKRPIFSFTFILCMITMVSRQTPLVSRKSNKKTCSWFAAVSQSKNMSQQNSTKMEDDLGEKPNKTCCFSRVSRCFRKLCRRLRRKRSQHLAVSLPHGETGDDEHDDASPPPLPDHSEMGEEARCSEATGNLQAETAVAETRSIEQNLKQPGENENTSMNTPPSTGFSSPVSVDMGWEKEFSCSGEHNESGNMELERNEPPNYVIKTKHNEQNEAKEEKHDNNNDFDDQNDKCKAEITSLCQNKDKQTDKKQGNDSTEEKAIECNEQSHKTKRTRCHRGKKKKKNEKKEEKHKNTMEEKKVSCSVRVPANNNVTAIHLLARQAASWLCFKKWHFYPAVTIHLDPEKRKKIADSVDEFSNCRIDVDFKKIKVLDPVCYVKMKAKRHHKTIGKTTFHKTATDTRRLIECLQHSQSFDKIHVVLDVFSYHPLDCGLQVKTEAAEQPAESFPKAQAAAEIEKASEAITTGKEDQDIEFVAGGEDEEGAVPEENVEAEDDCVTFVEASTGSNLRLPCDAEAERPEEISEGAFRPSQPPASPAAHSQRDRRSEHDMRRDRRRARRYRRGFWLWRVCKALGNCCVLLLAVWFVWSGQLLTD